ncbi:MAG: hypothetical protein PHX83_04090 [Acidobacteriia bacterium]|nr:hypothetical protein [Terriglobia bacterium]
MDGKNYFSRLDGTPAQILIVLGLLLVLAVPLIPRFREAAIDSARVRSDQAGQMIQLDMEKFNRDQTEERNRINSDSNLPLEERTKKLQALTDAANQKNDELEKKYDSNTLKRELLEAQANAAGSRIQFVISWLGRLMLLLGLLVITLQSEGARQKVILVILLVVMFTTLSGINFDFATIGHFGESQSDIIRQMQSR